MRHALLHLLAIGFISYATAQDGPQLYTIYCSACHGSDGKGASSGAFPPLAGSPWVAGEPDRAINIVLHGMHGPVQVGSRSYDLEMPPQGAMLPDDQIAAILTHVRNSWGNQATKVEASQVKAQRDAHVGRGSAWTAEDLLKEFPLPLEKTVLTNLISRTYEGEWNDMPDFSKLKPVNVEEEHDGLLDVGDAPRTDHFAIVWEGRFEAGQKAEYHFLLDADDAAQLWIDAQPVVAVVGRGAMDGTRAKRGKIELTKGSHAIRVAYLEISGQESMALGWRTDGKSDFRWLTPDRSFQRKGAEPIPVEPENDRPVIYRNFIQGTSPRAIGVGFPGGFNLAWSADHLAPELLWTGAFMDGAARWLERGTRPSPPAGEQVVQLSSERVLPANSRFRGYQLDGRGNPTFIVTLGEQTLRDGWSTGTAKDGTSCLQRTLSLSGGSASLRIPLGRFERIESTDAVVQRDGVDNIDLKPGKTTVHSYVFPH